MPLPRQAYLGLARGGDAERPVLIIQSIRKFVRNRRANVALTTALAALPLSMMLGMGIDIGNATRVRMALQDATDEAAISLARQAPSIADSAISSTALSFIQSNYKATSASTVSITNATIDRNTITATLDAQARAPTYFSQLVGVSSMPVTAHAVAKGMLLEISMVLDTSGSMSQSAGSGGSKISALKTAADEFLDAMFGTQTTSQRVSIGIVPFAASVNVGSANANAAWMDTTGASSIAEEDFSSNAKTRWALFNDMGVAWKGCVITRPSVNDYDVKDVTASSSDPDSLFVPWFAPDEPDGDNGGLNTGSFNNNYLNDEGGNCSGANTNKSVTDATKQARTCKYKNATPAGGLGPNYLCDSNAITPLTSARSTLDSAVSALQANGNTNILEGLTWGWRVLSPGAPFTQGKTYTAPNNRKVIVLMTDGVNNLNGVSNFDHSDYTSYGYMIKGRVGSTSSNNTTLTSALDARTATACANAKAQGILIYTIGFGAGAAGSTSLLQGCATDPKYAYFPQNSSDLSPVFAKIAQSINSLRIAE